LRRFPRGCAFDLMVCLLWLAAATPTRQWHLTVSPDLGTGTFVDLLRIVAPHVPAGLLPPAPSLKRIRGLRDLALNSVQNAEFTAKCSGADFVINPTTRRQERS
jgi:hypothetical protein